jgi:triphosphoribosyl-dephospho-CoA synthase
LSRGLPPSEIALFAQAAAVLEVASDKPGNVSRQRDFGDTTFEDFLLSGVAIGAAMGAVLEAGVGETVLRAVRDTRRWVSVNTNLGIILLLAPLARAAAQDGASLRERVSRVLSALTVEDAVAAYAAIRLAAPGGLGRVESQDVSGQPTLTLRDAMALAAPRDTIAREYVTDYAVTFGVALPALRRARLDGLGWSPSALECYLHVLAEVPDTLVERKAGRDAARAVSERARQVLAAGRSSSPEREQAAAAFDRELRGDRNRLNPGTSADLVAAALFAALSEER